VVTLKFAFHRPTYRQQDWFAQCGWFPSRSTINDLLNYSVETVQPLVGQFWSELLQQPILCSQILSLYRQLYAIEERAKTWTAEARYALRQREAVPIWQTIEQWLASESVRRAALPSSRFGKAVGYLKNQCQALQKYLSDGRLPIDSDQAEQIIRPLAVGRRNWLFLGHPAAAPGRMQLLSVVSSAHRHNLIVEDYLTDVLTQLADAKQHHPCDLEIGSPYLLDLLPDRWAAAHPKSIRHGRVAEKQATADAKRVRRARRRQRARQQKMAAT
jgi:hypothetical protein